MPRWGRRQSSDWTTDSEHSDLHIGWEWGTCPDWGIWGDVYRRSWGSARISEPAGVDDGEIYERPVCWFGSSDVPDWGSWEIAVGRKHRVFGAKRLSGEDPRFPDRAWGD